MHHALSARERDDLRARIVGLLSDGAVAEQVRSGLAARGARADDDLPRHDRSGAGRDEDGHAGADIPRIAPRFRDSGDGILGEATMGGRTPGSARHHPRPRLKEALCSRV